MTFDLSQSLSAFLSKLVLIDAEYTSTTFRISYGPPTKGGKFGLNRSKPKEQVLSNSISPEHFFYVILFRLNIS